MALKEERKVIAVMRGGKPVLEGNVDLILYGAPSQKPKNLVNKCVVKIMQNGIEINPNNINNEMRFGAAPASVPTPPFGMKIVKAYKGGEEIFLNDETVIPQITQNTIYVEAIFDVQNAGIPINILGTNNSLNMSKIESMSIDGKNVNPIKIHKFTSPGQHVVKIGLYDANEIPAYMFYKCNYLSRVKIPSTIENICKYAFYGCSILNNVGIPDSVLTIEDNVFHNCSTLSNITLSQNIVTIGEKTFRYCTNLKEIILPKNLISISKNLFHGCSVLLSVKIPNSVEVIESEAFSRCSNLSVVFLPNALKVFNIKEDGDNKYAGTFYACTKLNTIYCPSIWVNDLPKYVFQDVKQNGVLHVRKDCSNKFKSWMKTGEYYLGHYNWTIVEDI